MTPILSGWSQESSFLKSRNCRWGEFFFLIISIIPFCRDVHFEGDQSCWRRLVSIWHFLLRMVYYYILNHSHELVKLSTYCFSSGYILNCPFCFNFCFAIKMLETKINKNYLGQHFVLRPLRVTFLTMHTKVWRQWQCRIKQHVHFLPLPIFLPTRLNPALTWRDSVSRTSDSTTR